MEEQYLYLTTTGRKTGNPHKIEIWYVAHGDRYYLVAEHGKRSDWVRNIQQDARVTFRVANTTTTGAGRIIDHEAETALVRVISALMDQKYGWSNGLIVEITPQ